MKVLANPRFLTIYSGVLTVVFAVTILSGFSSVTKPTRFDGYPFNCSVTKTHTST
jgi:hypothetical protein